MGDVLTRLNDYYGWGWILAKQTQNSEYLIKIIRCEIIDSSLQSPNSLALNFLDFATGGES